jgi:predicted component of type VI protein secretion system
MTETKKGNILEDLALLSQLEGLTQEALKTFEETEQKRALAAEKSNPATTAARHGSNPSLASTPPQASTPPSTATPDKSASVSAVTPNIVQALIQQAQRRELARKQKTTASAQGNEPFVLPSVDASQLELKSTGTPSSTPIYRKKTPSAEQKK